MDKATDVNQIEITSLSHIKGQPQVQSLLKVSLDAYFQNRSSQNAPTFGPVLLVGPSGTGKSITAKAIHCELGNLKLIESNGEMLNNISELTSALLSSDDNTTLFIDECQSLGTKAQNLLLTAISEKKLYVPKGKSNRSCHSIPLANFTIIFASTHEYQVQDALRNRIRLYCRFEYYNLNDLADIVKQRVLALGWKVETDAVIEEIAKRAKQTPRLALNRNLQMVYNVASSKGNKTISITDTLEAFQLLQVDELGLDALERSYLAELAKFSSMKLNVIASKIGLPRQTICSVIEPYLLRQELIMKDGSERIITEKGLEHISKNG